VPSDIVLQLLSIILFAVLFYQSRCSSVTGYKMDMKLKQSAYLLRKNIFKIYQIFYQAIKIDRRIDLFIHEDHRRTGCLNSFQELSMLFTNLFSSNSHSQRFVKAFDNFRIFT